MAITIHDLMKELNQKAEELKLDIMDNHVAAFIFSKLGIAKELNISSLKDYPALSYRRELIILAIFSLAQKASGIENLNNIAQYCINMLDPIVATINNKKTRESLTEKFNTIIKNKSSLSSILSVIADPVMLKKDISGFVQAQNKAKKLIRLKIQLSNKNKAAEIGYRQGLNFCIMISYVLLSVVFIYSFCKGL